MTTILAVFAATALSASTRLTNIAVNDLNAFGISKDEALLITERLRSELVIGGQYRVLDRGQMEQIINEQTLSQSGACDQSECAVQIGKLLSVDQIIVGLVGRIGSMYTLQTKIISIETGEIITSKSIDFAGDVERILTEAIPKMANELSSANMISSKEKDQFGDLYITTSPVGAKLTVGSKEYDEISPMTIENIQAQSYQIRATRGYLIGKKSITVVPETVTKVAIPLDTGLGSLRIVSSPVNSLVKLNGIAIGETPMRLNNGIKAGRHKLQVSHPGYFDYISEFEVFPEQLVNLNSITLSPMSQLTIKNSYPAETKISNETHIITSRSTDTTIRLHPGKYQIATIPESNALLAVFDSITVGKFDSVIYASKKRPKYGSLVLTTDYFADVSIVQSDSSSNYLGKAPFRIDTLIPGQYILRITSSNTFPSNIMVQIEPGKTTDKVVPLRLLSQNHVSP